MNRIKRFIDSMGFVNGGRSHNTDSDDDPALSSRSARFPPRSVFVVRKYNISRTALDIQMIKAHLMVFCQPDHVQFSDFVNDPYLGIVLRMHCIIYHVEDVKMLDPDIAPSGPTH